MNLRQFAYFVVACQQHSLASAASELGITPSTLSVSLKSLAHDIGLPLFERVQQRLHPTAAALWLFRSVLPLLHAERFIRDWVRDSVSPVPQYLLVDVRLSFALGRVTKAISAAITHMQVHHPGTFIELHFVGAGLNGNDMPALGTPVLETTPRRIQIDAIAPGEEPELRQKGQHICRLLKDAWVLVRAINGVGTDRTDPMSVPMMVPSLSDGLRYQLRMLVKHGQLPALHFLEASPGELPRLLVEHPQACFLLPRSMLSGRLQSSDVQVTTIRCAGMASDLCSHVIAQYDAGDRVATHLVQLIAGSLETEECNATFTPALTLRQLHSHQMLHRWRNMTVAARRLTITQPSLTEHVSRIERVLGVALFVRGRKGVEPTAHSERLHKMGTVIEDGIRRVLVQRASIHGIREKQLRFGVLPTGDSDSVLLRCLADAITGWQASHPGCQLTVIEAPSGQLRELLLKGTLGLALIEHDQGTLARLRLEPGEPLSVIADPQFGLFQGDAIDLAAVARLPLVLPMGVSGLRQLLDTAAEQRGVRLNVVAEVNSMVLTLALLSRQAVCTVLPASAVQHALETGELIQARICQPVIVRRFHAMYSTDRTLSETERDFVRELRIQFDARRRTVHQFRSIQIRNTR